MNVRSLCIVILAYTLAASLLLKCMIASSSGTSSTYHRSKNCERDFGTFKVRLRESIGFNTLNLAPQNRE